ncbi:MAG: tryptophan-rich sensory protein [Spirochaetaceae bacterium]|nr:tryptophan-rich sensory protein [Spirochaetaceae bacterium]
MKSKIKILVVLTFIIMIVTNVLANTLPLNGMNTGVVSDSYPNLFAPAGITFAIWGVIYLLLGMFSFYQLGIINKNDNISSELLNKIGIIFSISSIINTIWIFTWHYKIIPLSMIFMIGLLVCLIKIVNAIKEEKLSTKEKLFVKVPFSIYFGWITVATIANATVLLVSLNWNAFGISESIWTVIIIIIGAIIGILTLLTNKDYFYGLVFIWAYYGIIIKHTTEYNSRYPSVIITAIICIIVVLAANIYAFTKKEY